MEGVNFTFRRSLIGREGDLLLLFPAWKANVMTGIHSNLEKEAKMIEAQVADRMELYHPGWLTPDLLHKR